MRFSKRRPKTSRKSRSNYEAIISTAWLLWEIIKFYVER